MYGATEPLDSDKNVRECAFDNTSEYEHFKCNFLSFLAFLKEREALEDVGISWTIWTGFTQSFSVEELGLESLDELQKLNQLRKINLKLINRCNWNETYYEGCEKTSESWAYNPVNMLRLEKIAKLRREEREKSNRT